MATVFHISVYALTALAALILAMAEEFPLPTALTLPIAGAALYWNEWRRTIRLRVITANLLGVLAFVVAGIELTSETLEGRVLAGAHLLTYLSWIAMFQSKSGRQYWWLLALSVMQIAVAAILTESGAFGFLLVLYVFCGMWTLAVYSVYQAYHNFERAGVATETQPRIEPVHSSVSVSATSSSKKTPDELHEDLTQPLVHRQSSEFQSAIQLDPDQRWINLRFVVGVVSTSIMSLVVGMIFFTMVPRLWVGRRTISAQDTPPIQSMTGFTDEVQLGALGRILESNEPVFQAWFYKAGSNTPMTIEDVCRRHGFRDSTGFPTEPMFRGSVMGRYENGRWSVLDESRQAAQLLPPQIRLHNHYIRQEYVLEQSGTKTLFAIHPVFWADRDDDNKAKVAMDVATAILMRDDNQNSLNGTFKYSVYSYSPSSKAAARIAYHSDAASRAKRRQIQPKFAAMPRGLEKLTALAKQIEIQALGQDLKRGISDIEIIPGVQTLAQQRRETARRIRIAQAVESFLGNSDDYTYSLETTAVDSTLDPVEDFLINRKEGHCEYYASAMALMMRSLGIESRLVSGFKGGEVSLSGAFVVSERHAHAWVEVLVGREWKLFDPTPASRSDVVREIGEEQGLFGAISDIATGLWHQRVIRLSIREQRRSIYEPIGNWLKSKLRLLGPAGTAIARHLSKPSGWFSWQTFVGVFVLVLGSLGIRKLWKRLFPNGFLSWIVSTFRSLSRSMADKKNQVRIEFYERFVRIVAKQGITRRASQTPLEFALESQHSLNEQLALAGLVELPDDIAQRFYEVRYGNRELSAPEQQGLEQHLKNLELALQSGDKKDS
jgi:protein-glutamine gamma-glutamyltransferase